MVVAAATAMIICSAKQIVIGQSEVLLFKCLIWPHPLSNNTRWALENMLAGVMMSVGTTVGTPALRELSG